jgi:LuxR family transcriptional regulator, maltose regulon positive regulatory protein
MVAKIPVSRTKVIVPALRPEILHRARLLALFDDLLEKKLILVTAPAGYGKTTLLVDFAHQTQIPVCWLSLDALDRDPQHFIAYFIAAIAQQFPRFGQQSRAALKKLTSLERDSEMLLSVLVNDAYDHINEHFALVIDDFQFIDSDLEICKFVSHFIHQSAEHCHIILSSRRLPALPDMTLLVARQQVSGFDLDELAFQPDEIHRLFEKNYEIALDDIVLEELIRRTDGWITGLHLAGPGTRRAIPDLTRAARAAGVNLADYFDQQVLSQQPVEVRSFLLSTSLLGEFDAGLCASVFGKGNWKKLIEIVQRSNLFVLPVGPQGRWLRYHPLFQEFLQACFQTENPEKAHAIYRRLAQVFEQNGDWEKAYHIYQQQGEDAALIGLVERAGTPMLLSERLLTLKAWLNSLPVFSLQERPALLSIRGALLCALGEGSSALALLDLVIPAFRNAGDLPGLALALVRRAAAYRIIGDYAKSLADADESRLLTENVPDLALIYAEALRFKGINLFRMGSADLAIRSLEESLHQFERLGEMQSIIRLRMELGITYRATGKYPAAEQVYRQVLVELRRESDLNPQANIFNNLGVLHHVQGNYELAIKVLQEGLTYAQRTSLPWQKGLLLASLGDVLTDLDEFESANQIYHQAADTAQAISYQFLTNYLNLVQVHLARLRGQTQEAYLHLHEAEALVLATGSNYECGLFYMEYGCLQLVEEKVAPAIANLEKALDHFQRGSLAAETACTQIWLAAASLRAGNVTAARAQLKPILETGQAGLLFHSLLQVVRQARSWLVLLREDAEIGFLLTDWLEKVAQLEAQLPALRKRLRRLLVVAPIKAPHLAIHAFGKMQVWINGKLVPSTQWKTASVRELFFFFLTMTRPITKEEIGEMLWPESDFQQLKLRFKNELYRLRHALGQDIIRFENNAYSFNRNVDYEYDIENFDTTLAKAQSAVQVEEKISLLCSASCLRNGPYLQDLDAAWLRPERERLERACLQAFKQLAEFQRQVGDLQAALQACQEALKIDVGCEDVHRLAMQIHAERGDQLAVIWQYQYCRDALRADLDVAPSSETENLYQRLTT